MTPSPSYSGLLRQNPDFRRLWLGQVVSFFGDWFMTIALYTVVQDLTGSAQAIAAVMVARLLPIFAMTPIAGPLCDRFDRKWLMIGTDIARAVLVWGLVVAHRVESLPLLFVTLVVMVCFSGIFIPARTSSIPQLTEPHELSVALALSAGTWSVMLAFGAAAGGVVTELAGVDAALVFDSATFLLSAAFLWGLPSLPPRRASSQSDTGFFDGLRYMRDRPYLATVVSLKGFIGLSGGAVVTIPMFGNGIFAATAGPLFIGALYAFRGSGALIGTLVVRRFTGDNPDTMRSLIAPGFVWTACCYCALYLAPNIWLAGLCFLLAGVGTGMVWVFASNLGQLAADREYRGRVFSLEFAGMTLAMATASYAAGVAIDKTDLEPAHVAGICGLLMFMPALLWWGAMRALRPEGTGKPATASPLSGR